MCFSSIDTLFSEHWCKKLALSGPEVKDFLAALFFTSRKGHFCLDLQTDLPELTVEKERLKTGAIAFFKNKRAETSNLVKRWHDAFYLMRQFDLEKDLITHCNKLIFKRNEPSFSIENSANLSSEQKNILTSTQRHSPIFITGGPGTGKTFLAKTLIQAYLKSNPNALVTICAFTAKAAFLFESIQSERVEIKTLHSLIKPHKKTRTMIQTDLLIIDECSMIGPSFFNTLLASIFKETLTVFMGDPHQLPPVQSLSVFEHLANCLKQNHFQLLSSFRSNSAIQALSLALLTQNKKDFFYLLKSNSYLEFVDIHSIHLISYLVKSLKKAYPKETCSSNPDKLLILTPFRHSSKGYLLLNKALQEQLNFSFTPITIEKNDPSLQLCNGQMGVLVDDIAHFYFANQTKKYHKSLLPPFSPSFVTSIHKSQGSSADHCIIILDKPAEFFNINLLYTAITRAKVKITLISDKTALTQVIQEEAKLTHRLESHLAP